MNPYLAPGLIIAAVAAVRGMWSPCGLSMISSITPMSERAKGHRFGVTASWFTLGAVVGGATTGAAMAAGAWLVASTGASATVTVWLFGAATLVTIASDLHLFGFALPTHPRQVNETWLKRFRAWAYASGFGWQIGTGFATYIMTGGVYLLVAAGVCSGDPIMAFGLGIAFGLIRGLCVFVASGADEPAKLQRLHGWIERHAEASLDAAIGAQILGVGVLAVTGDALWLSGVTAVGLVATVVVRVRRSNTIVDSVGEHPRRVVSRA